MQNKNLDEQILNTYKEVLRKEKIDIHMESLRVDKIQTT